jgi:hypothetical protein
MRCRAHSRGPTRERATQVVTQAQSARRLLDRGIYLPAAIVVCALVVVGFWRSCLTGSGR